MVREFRRVFWETCHTLSGYLVYNYNIRRDVSVRKQVV